MRALKLLVFIAALAAGPLATAKELYELPWIEARSTNFIVNSAISEKETIAAVRDLEDFRRVVAIFSNVSRVDEQIPTRVFLLPGPAAELGLGADIGGYFMPGMRANFALARRTPGMPISTILQHEYAHFLMRNHSGQAYPRWYDEGFAELVSTIRFKDGQVTFGGADPNRVSWLTRGSWLPYARVVDDAWSRGKRSREDVAQFYAQAWALTHYLMMGPDGDKFPARSARYLELLEAGTPPKVAFETAMEQTVSGLPRQITAYLPRSKGLRFSLDEPYPASDIKLVRLAVPEIAAALGKLSARIGKSDVAARYYAVALAGNPNQPLALTGQADQLLMEKRYAEAGPLYERAVAAEPDNPAHYVDMGEYFVFQAEDTEDPDERRRLLGLARQQYVKGHKLDEENPELLAKYGYSFQLPGEPVEKGLDTLELAHQILPSDFTIKLALARSYLALDRPADARPLVNAVAAWVHGEQSAELTELLAEIDARLGAETPADEDSGAEEAATDAALPAAAG